MDVNVTALIFFVVSATALLTLPRRWAPIPLLATCCYMTTGQGIELGPFSLPVYRMALAVGLLRVILRREGIPGSINGIDKLLIAWATWMIFASLFHEWQPGSGPVYASGFVFNVGLVYLLTRIWCCDLGELTGVLRVVGWLLVPVALAMVAEHLVERNVFGVLFGGVPEGVYFREGHIRAQGPFAHPILAGTVGAVCFPLLTGIWQRYRVSGTIGLAACVTIVLASYSTGPLVSLFVACVALGMWSVRRWTRVIQLSIVGAYIAADILMRRPAYYLISEIDLTGSSTGWHRSRLIEVAFEHLSEWWLFGTDYTFHWIGLAVDEAGKHSDITNYYLWIGTIAGLPAMLLLIATLWRAFTYVGRTVRDPPVAVEKHRFQIWCLGAGLLTHTVTSLSMSYPDQSVMFFWLNVGAISSMYSTVVIIIAAKAKRSPEAAPRIAQQASSGLRNYFHNRPKLKRPNGQTKGQYVGRI